MIKQSLPKKDTIEKYKKYRNTTTKFKAYKMNQQVFDIDQNYEPQAIMGEGACGMVVAALDVNKKEMVAIKKIINPFEHNFFTRRTLRQLKLLRLLKHTTIMKIQTILLPKARENLEDIYVVSELLETDLMSLIKSEHQLSQDHWKFFMYQVLEGIDYLHKANVIHRDLKPRNVLVNKDCDIKICDFGLARVIDPRTPISSSYVATRWYRAPQLLLGTQKYTNAIDVWSAGIIFAELILRKPFLPGHNTRDQIQKICNFFGTSSLDVIKDLSQDGKQIIKNLPINKTPKSFQVIFSKVSPIGLDLLKKLLTIDSTKRITAQQALNHPYFKQYQYQKRPQQPIDINQFQFELYELTTQQLKDMIYQQILIYHYKDFSEQYEQKKKNKISVYKEIFAAEKLRNIEKQQL